jgi:hypothetical protein
MWTNLFRRTLQGFVTLGELQVIYNQYFIKFDTPQYFANLFGLIT